MKKRYLPVSNSASGGFSEKLLRFLETGIPLNCWALTETIGNDNRKWASRSFIWNDAVRLASSSAHRRRWQTLRLVCATHDITARAPPLVECYLRLNLWTRSFFSRLYRTAIKSPMDAVDWWSISPRRFPVSNCARRIWAHASPSDWLIYSYVW